MEYLKLSNNSNFIIILINTCSIDNQSRTIFCCINIACTPDCPYYWFRFWFGHHTKTCSIVLFTSNSEEKWKKKKKRFDFHFFGWVIVWFSLCEFRTDQCQLVVVPCQFMLVHAPVSCRSRSRVGPIRLSWTSFGILVSNLFLYWSAPRASRLDAGRNLNLRTTLLEI